LSRQFLAAQKNGASLSIRILHMVIISAAASGFYLPESKILIKNDGKQ
jgi:hypothetical protein